MPTPLILNLLERCFFPEFTAAGIAGIREARRTGAPQGQILHNVRATATRRC